MPRRSHFFHNVAYKLKKRGHTSDSKELARID